LNGQLDNMGILEYFFTIMQKIKVLPIETGENRVTFLSRLQTFFFIFS